MPDVTVKERLKKEHGLRDVCAIETGATLSAGFFLLLVLAAIREDPPLVLAYLMAAFPLIPAMFNVIKLVTAMPRVGRSIVFWINPSNHFFYVVSSQDIKFICCFSGRD